MRIRRMCVKRERLLGGGGGGWLNGREVGGLNGVWGGGMNLYVCGPLPFAYRSALYLYLLASPRLGTAKQKGESSKTDQAACRHL
jgi:hypothetical protein